MATTSQQRERPWRWAALVLGLAWLSIGCNPGTLSMFFLPFTDDKIPPACKLAAKNKETTVCVVAHFAAPAVLSDVAPADGELADAVTVQLRKRSQENKDKVKVVAPKKVRDLQAQEGDGMSPLAIGKKCNADKVIVLEIQSMSLYEKNSYPQLYRGNVDMIVRVLDVNQAEGENTLFTELYRCAYPGTRGPVDAADMTVMQFRTRFVNKIAGDVARFFVAYPREQRLDLD